jgi:uncharacterized membrane protein YgcG
VVVAAVMELVAVGMRVTKSVTVWLCVLTVTVKMAVDLLVLVPVLTVDAVSTQVAVVQVMVAAALFWLYTNYASSNKYSGGSGGGGGGSRSSRGIECPLALTTALIVVTAV